MSDGPVDRQRAVDCLFDAENSAVLAELEDGEKPLPYLSSKSGIPEERILSNLSYLVEIGVLSRSVRGGSVHLSADHRGLSDLVESDGNFGAAIDGLTKMDGYLN